MNNPGEYLKSIREEKHLGVKTVYAATGVGDSTIRSIETGETQAPSALHLKKLADYYHIDVISLYFSYGYLDENDIKSFSHFFQNTEFLNKEEIESVQKIINLLCRKRSNNEI